jgi:hypothetical protein
MGAPNSHSCRRLNDNSKKRGALLGGGRGRSRPPGITARSAERQGIGAGGASPTRHAAHATGRPRAAHATRRPRAAHATRRSRAAHAPLTRRAAHAPPTRRSRAAHAPLTRRPRAAHATGRPRAAHATGRPRAAPLTRRGRPTATVRATATGRPRGAVFSENLPTFGANFLYGVIPDLSNGYRCRAPCETQEPAADL